MSRHTKRPFRVHKVTDHCVQVRAENPTSPGYEITVAVLGGWGTSAEENAANADLFSAAPELLELAEVVAALDPDRCNAKTIRSLQLIAAGALKKANQS